MHSLTKEMRCSQGTKEAIPTHLDILGYYVDDVDGSGRVTKRLRTFVEMYLASASCSIHVAYFMKELQSSVILV